MEEVGFFDLDDILVLDDEEGDPRRLALMTTLRGIGCGCSITSLDPSSEVCSEEGSSSVVTTGEASGGSFFFSAYDLGINIINI